MHPRDQFSRTVCDCDKCRKPCRSVPGMLAPQDLERIADYLDLPIHAALPLFRASPGAKVAKLTAIGPQIFRIRTIVPASDKDGTCVFLRDDGRCDIHLVAPFGCSHFDMHLSRHEGDRRSSACLRAIMEDDEYQVYWHALAADGLVTEAPETKRRRLEEATR